MGDIFYAVVVSILPTVIPLIAWAIATVFAVRMVRNNGGRPERFLLIGVSLMLTSSLISSAIAGLNTWLVFKLAEAEIDRVTIAGIFGIIRFFSSFISLAGIILLIYAFWQKFRDKQTQGMTSD